MSLSQQESVVSDISSIADKRKHDNIEKKRKKKGFRGKSFFVISALLDKELSKLYLVVQVYILIIIEVELLCGFLAAER